MKRITISLKDLRNIVTVIDNTVNSKWNTDVPIIPGKPPEKPSK